MVISKKLILLLVLGVLVLVPPVLSQSALSVTASTNKPQYSPGETVSVSGFVRDNQSIPVFGAGISVQVNGPDGKLIHVQLESTDQSGSYVDAFPLPMDSNQGQYTVYVSAKKPGYTVGQSQIQFSVQVKTSSTTSSSASQTTSSSTGTNQPKCLIATATYGSELAPEVMLLRNFRDRDILQTTAGASFMEVFNSFYYSFSPQAASTITSHSDVRAGMRILLYPMIGVLYASSLVFAAISFNSEVAVLAAGVLASFGIGAIYISPITIIASRLFKSRFRTSYAKAVRGTLLIGIASLLGVFLAEVTQLGPLLAMTTTGTVLSCMTLGGLSIPMIVSYPKLRIRADF